MYIINMQSIIKHLTILTFHESNGLVEEPLFLFFVSFPFPAFFLLILLTRLNNYSLFLNSFDKNNSWR